MFSHRLAVHFLTELHVDLSSRYVGHQGHLSSLLFLFQPFLLFSFCIRVLLLMLLFFLQILPPSLYFLLLFLRRFLLLSQLFLFHLFLFIGLSPHCLFLYASLQTPILQSVLLPFYQHLTFSHRNQATPHGHHLLFILSEQLVLLFDQPLRILQ